MEIETQNALAHEEIDFAAVDENCNAIIAQTNIQTEVKIEGKTK